jgi:uncharacterized membrane protein YphA (DoxX/SURF4 family)
VHVGIASYFAYIAGVVETLGGLLLALGLFTCIAGPLLASEMAIAFLCESRAPRMLSVVQVAGNGGQTREEISECSSGVELQSVLTAHRGVR